MSIQAVPTDIIFNEYASWRAYWQSQGQPWRTELEIDAQRQEELASRLATSADVQQGRYPFRACALSRADVEWLLAARQTHTLHQHKDPQHHNAQLDLRGADLSKVDLRGLPLRSIRGGLSEEEWRIATFEQRDMAALHLERADLRGTSLEGALLRGAHLEGADLRDAYLGGADLRDAHLEGKGHSLKPLPAADLRMVYFDSNTLLDNITLGDQEHGVVKVADVHWNGINLAPLAWNKVDILGDELDALQWKDLDSYRAAVRANRQLASVLYSQGLHEDANHFAYRALVNQRVILRRQLILPLVLRLMQQPQMPLPLVFRRAEQWWQSQRRQSNIAPMMLARMTLLFLILACFALWQPIILTLILCLCIVSFSLLYLLLRRRARLPYPYQPAQAFVLPPKLASTKQRLQQKRLVLLHFLLGKPLAKETQTLTHTWLFPSLLLFLAIVDNTIVSCTKYLFLLLLDVLSGYGYKWGRTLSCYIILLLGFGMFYALLGHLPPLTSLLLSIASFHGRGFFADGIITASNPLTMLEAGESIVGLVIEICLLVTVIRYRLRG